MPSTLLRIGLLGGSFNPAHAGHLYISQEALKRLQLDEVWWLVTPQNPLKPQRDMAPYAERFAKALEVTRGTQHISVSDFEEREGLHYTYATLRALIRRYPKVQFVWIMGADNLASFHRWQRWRSIARMVPIAVFDRAPFSHQALHAKAALALTRWRLPQKDIASLATRAGRWAYILIRRHPASSTALRTGA
jgi:nicotinate-nucleotide adenylyltransferase